MLTPQNLLSNGGASQVKESGARPRSMAPKEHGAWGQLGFPLLVALAMGSPNPTSIGFTIAAIALFTAHEPLVVLLGQRGTRAAREAAMTAKRRLLLTVGIGVISGGSAMLSANWAARGAVLFCVVLSAIAIGGFLLRGRERSASGELWIAWTLPASGIPVALGSVVSSRDAVAVWLSFALAYSAGVFGVRGLIRDHREGVRSAGWLGLGSVLLVTMTLLPNHAPAAIGALLFWAVVAVCRMARPSLKSLKRIGWVLIAASVAQAVWLVAAIRLAPSGL